ncbi:hypothetical protein CDD83_9704 [Cordyceps sp. RAO-2017]|nr:hypothetical protein CDD83_9704 [Cordyceps sp. RAO-2017]
MDDASAHPRRRPSAAKPRKQPEQETILYPTEIDDDAPGRAPCSHKTEIDTAGRAAAMLYDLHLAWTPAWTAEQLAQTLALAAQLGYGTVALNHTLELPLPGRPTAPFPAAVPPHVLRRATLLLADPAASNYRLAALAGRTLGSADSGVRMDAVKLCVALHERVGDAAFWAALHGVDEDPKSLITYYIVKQQREHAAAVAP